MYKAFHPGEEWLDTDNKPIEAHGGKIYFEQDTYYWYGENKMFTDGEQDTWTWGIKAYSSKDLYNWKDEGLIIPPEETDTQSPMYPSQRIDRPHIIYNTKTKKYVCWIKLSGEKACFVILSALSFLGPYKLEKTDLKPFGKKAGDFDLVVDETNNQGYLFFDANHEEIISCTLSDDFMDTTDQYEVNFPGLVPPFVREAPAYLKRKGKHYLLTSGLTNYVPNPSEAAVSNRCLGPYQSIGNLHPEDDTASSYSSQISGVFKVPGEDLYIALADRWIPDYVASVRKYDTLSRAIASNYDVQYQVTEDEKKELIHSPIVKPVNTSKARYVWLPIEWKDDQPFILWKKEWTIEEYIN